MTDLLIKVTFRKTTHQRYDKKGLKVGGGLHPLLASGLASPLQLDNRLLQDRRQLADQRHISRGRCHHHRCRYYSINQRPSHYRATRLQRPSPASPTFYRPAPISSPDAPPRKKTRTDSPISDFTESSTR